MSPTLHVSPTEPKFAVSTWSLHRTLGVMYADKPGYNGERTAREVFGKPQSALLEIPAKLAAMGISRVEISHFHLPSRDVSYCDELKHALAESGVEMFTLLVEDGDMTHPDDAARDLAWMAECVTTAGHLGAKRARIIAGKQEHSPATMEKSVAGFHELVKRGSDCGVEIVTENWFDLLDTPEAVNELFERLDGSIGLNADFGNWEGSRKYTDLAAIFPLAQSCHAKCNFDAAGTEDWDDYGQCLEIAQNTNFSGVYTLVYDAPDSDEWGGLAREKQFITEYCQKAH